MKRNERSKGIFIAGTDTGVGKTLIAGAIARTLVSQGIDCGVMKPIETACQLRGKHLIPADGTYLLAAARSDQAIASVTPYRYRLPLSPYAAALEGGAAPVDLKEILAVYQRAARAYDYLIVEGLGGLMVPLTARHHLADLIKMLKLPVLLVAHSGLGTLNHSLLSLYHGETLGISFMGIILNRTFPKRPASEKTNLRILAEQGPLPVLGPFPYLSVRGDREARIAQSAKSLARIPSIIMLIKKTLGLGF